jgi:hypothetical protein
VGMAVVGAPEPAADAPCVRACLTPLPKVMQAG